MDPDLKESSKKIIFMVKVPINGAMEENILEHGEKIKCMEKVFLHGVTVEGSLFI